MKSPILVVMAAGMGSRYGGLKQIDPIGPYGEVLLDYSLYDAKKAGFETVVFIIKSEIESVFKERIGNRIAQHMEVRYAFQELESIPQPYEVPHDRTKPWGTAHAVWCAKSQIDAPFAVINADDFYGAQAFEQMYQHLKTTQESAMVGYELGRTLSENGAVSRGLCQVDANGYLQEIEEQTHIEQHENRIRYTENGTDWQEVAADTLVSMNMWGFAADFPQRIESQLVNFLEKALANNPQKAEFYLPSVVRHYMHQEQLPVRVLPTQAQWVGVTYADDKPLVQQQLQTWMRQGIYTSPLWESFI
ncbi:MAG: sugar phosphate nucleotidyltransferase [Aerococcaceae bacterium]|nr:sugar phosphate nucleotidyltransferase [Aerococcaceae bacterium]